MIDVMDSLESDPFVDLSLSDFQPRSKSSISCDQCTWSHKKCDGCSPCSRCLSREIPNCTYSPKGKRGPKSTKRKRQKGMLSSSVNPLDLQLPLVSTLHHRKTFMDSISSFRSLVQPLCALLLSDEHTMVDPFVTQDPERRFLCMSMAATGALMMSKGSPMAAAQDFYDAAQKILTMELGNRHSMPISTGLFLMSGFLMAKSKPLECESLALKSYTMAESLSEDTPDSFAATLKSQNLWVFYSTSCHEERLHYLQKGRRCAKQLDEYVMVTADFLITDLQFSLSGREWIGCDAFNALLEEVENFLQSPLLLQQRDGWVCKIYTVVTQTMKAVVLFKDRDMEAAKARSNEVIESIKNDHDINTPCVLRGISLLSILVISIALGEIELFMDSFLLLQQKVGCFVEELPLRDSFAWVKECFPASFGSVLDQLLYSTTWSWVNGWFRGLSIDMILQQGYVHP